MKATEPEGLTEAQKEALTDKTLTVLAQRARGIRGYRLSGGASDRIKINPYLLPIVAALAPSITAGTGRRAAASYLVTARFIAGIETSAGKLFDEQFMAILGGQPVPDKDKYLRLKSEISTVGRRHKDWGKDRIEAEKKRLQAEAEPLSWLAEFDSLIVRDESKYYVSLKLGPWTINDTMAREMATAFGVAVSNGVTPVLGIIYGTEEDLSNKPDIVMGGANGRGILKVGGDLMEFVTGSAKAAADVLAAIGQGCRRFNAEYLGNPPFVEAIAAVEMELETLYGIPPDADIYAVATQIALGMRRS